jgi:hypothetical protein
MSSVTVSTTINQPRELVFDHLDDLSRHEAFTDHFLVAWTLTRTPATGVGAGARMRAKGAGRHPWITITVVESIRPERTVEHGRGGKGGRRRTRGIYRLADSRPGATTVSFTNEFTPAGLLERLQAPVARSYLRRQNARSLRRLKAILEAQARGCSSPAARASWAAPCSHAPAPPVTTSWRLPTANWTSSTPSPSPPRSVTPTPWRTSRPASNRWIGSTTRQPGARTTACGRPAPRSSSTRH